MTPSPTEPDSRESPTSTTDSSDPDGQASSASASTAAAVRVTLEIEFSGPCLFVRRSDDKVTIDVYIPDARLCDDNGTPNPKKLTHRDKTPAAAHAGYLRFDLAYLTAGSVTGLPPSDPTVVPRYEVVHRLQRGVLDFGIPATTTAIQGSTDLPNFKVFAKDIVPDPRLSDAVPPANLSLLTRAVLKGGTIKGIKDSIMWEMSPQRDLGGEPHCGKFAGVVRWSDTIPDKPLKVTLKAFGAANGVTIELTPQLLPGSTTEKIIVLKVANLCALNPLEWPELEERQINVPDDDFKWLYYLYAKEGGGEFPKLPRLPAPIPTLGESPGEDSSQNCFGGEG